MKKIICILLITITLCVPLSFGMTSTPQTSHHSVPMSSQEMRSVVGGGICGCVSFWVIVVCLYDPTGFFCE